MTLAKKHVGEPAAADKHGSAVDKADRRRQRIRELKERSERLHRSILVPRVLKGLLPIRARNLPYRASLPEQRERAGRFRASSSAYAAAFDDERAFVAETRVIDLDGLRWWVPLLQPDDEAAVRYYLAHQNFPYRAILQTREAAIGGVMLDIGANIGRMSIPRVILGDVSAAYCAEPDLLNYTCLVRNVRDNHLAGLVLPDRVAIGSEDGTVQLERASSAGGHRVIDKPGKKTGRSVVVPSLTIDTWLDRLGVTLEEIGFVKVDAQGSELHILKGARRLLAHKHVAWQIEIDTLLLGSRGVSADDLFAELHAHFTHFIDLNRTAAGARVHAIDQLADALAYTSIPGNRTDIFAFNLAATSAAGRESASA